MCLRQSWDESFGDMDMDTFKSLAPSFEGLEAVSFSGYGEPFLNPNLIEMIRIAREKMPSYSRIELTTNGTAGDGNLVKEAVKAGLTDISFSIDSVKSDTFSYIRTNGEIDSVIRCLDSVIKSRDKRGRGPLVSISVVAMQSTIKELPDIVHFAAENAVDAVWVNNVLPPSDFFVKEVLYDSHSDEVLTLFEKVKERCSESGVPADKFPLLLEKVFIGIHRGGKLSKEESDVLRIVKEAESTAFSLGGDFSMMDLLGREGSRFETTLNVFMKAKEIASSRKMKIYLPLIIPRTKRRCDFIEGETCFITWDGWIRPCNQLSHSYTCYHHGRRKKVTSVSFGKIPENDLKSIWESATYREFRKNVNEFAFAPCGDCRAADGCDMISPDIDFYFDCYGYEEPCGDCLWSRGVLQCP
ncbi:MAG: SPASM domain-containing protein [Deltaproteobacteria bacterium]|nr:SPASM domain-containing protein [Deltaproteobacteria bacterium]